MNDRGLQTETDATRTGVIVFLFEHRQTVCSPLSQKEPMLAITSLWSYPSQPQTHNLRQ